MKIKYTYDDLLEEKETTLFNSLEEFFQDKRGKMYKYLLTKERAEVTDTIVIATSYPSVITIELIKEVA